MPFDLSKESIEGYAKIFDGVYTVVEYHRPGYSDDMPRLSNRGFIFEADTKKSGKHLMMSGIPGVECIAKVQAIEKDTGLELKKIITSGDFHHMAMKDWLDAYPNVHFVHSSLKFPTTRNGEALLANEAYKARIELVEGPEIPSMQEEYGDILEFWAFNQFLTYDDKKATFSAKDSKTPIKEGLFSFMKKFSKVKCDTPFLCIWFYHKPSKEMVIEHNFDMCLSKAQVNEGALLIRLMTKTNQFKSTACAPIIPSAPYDLESCKRHCEQMQHVLGWDVTSIMDYHCELGTHIREYANKEDYVKEMTKVLKKTGEHDASGKALHAIKNKKSGGCTIS